MESMDIPCFYWGRWEVGSLRCIYRCYWQEKRSFPLKHWKSYNLTCAHAFLSNTIVQFAKYWRCAHSRFLYHYPSRSLKHAKTLVSSHLLFTCLITFSFSLFLNTVLAKNFQDRAHFSCSLPFPASLLILPLFPLVEILVTNL